jgi:hypothetical protein
MAKKTDYKRLWKREKERVKKMVNEVTRLRQANEALVDVMGRVRDGELDPKKIFLDDKMPMEEKVKEDLRVKKKFDKFMEGKKK